MNNTLLYFSLYTAGISGVIVFVFGLFVLTKNRKIFFNKIFFLFSLCVSLWLIGTALMLRNCGNNGLAEQIDRFIYIPVSFIPVLMYHLSLIFTKFKKQKIFLIIGYVFLSSFALLSRSPLFIDGIHTYSYGCHIIAQKLHNIFLPIFFLYVILFFVNTYIFYKKTKDPVKKAQARYFFLAFFVFSLGAAAFLPSYGVPIPPYTFLAELGGVLIMGYAISRYRLMDIRFVLGRGAVHLLSITTIVGFASVLMNLNGLLEQPLSYNLSGILIIILSIISFQPVFNFFEKIASKYFYYTFYNYQKVLKDLGKRMTRILELDKLSAMIVNTLLTTMKLDRTVVLLKNSETKHYQIQKNIGFREENGISLVKDNFLTDWLEKNQKPLVYEELSLIIRDTPKGEEKTNLENLKANMKTIEAALCLPLYIEERIIGMIVLGNKISGDPYSEQDINLLTNLSLQASIAFYNAKLYSEIRNFGEKMENEVEKRTKELQKAYKELEQLDQAKSEFISIASHQLRTPLSAIKGYISMMLENTYGKVSKKMAQPLKNIYSSNERLLKLVNELLNVSRIEAGRVEIKMEETNLEEIIDSVIEELENQADYKKISLKREKSLGHSTATGEAKKALQKISIDQDKIRQAILNIIDNAIRYTTKGGITVSIQQNNPNEKIIIAIKDTGEGMVKEEISDLFESFSIGKAGSKLWTEGTGLGLYVAKKFVEMNKGKIWAESLGKGKGSTFYIELPIKL